MRKCILYITVFSLILSGCGSIYSNYREVEQLLVIETMGFDYLPGGVQLTLASGISSAGIKGPIRLSGVGPTISAAMDQARNYSFEDELFCSQTNSVLIGEKAAREGMEAYLSYICQSPILRTDVPVFIIRGGSAFDSIMGSGDSQHGVSEILKGVTEYLETRGGSHIFKAAQISRDSLRHGSALCCALEYSESAEPPTESSQPDQIEGETSSARTLAVAGFGILKDNRLVDYIDKDAAVGVSFLINNVGISSIQLEDSMGRSIVLEISGGGSQVKPRWSEKGELTGLDIALEAKATVMEMNDDADLSRESYTKQLTQALELRLAQLVGDVLRQSAKLEADFLALGSQVEQHSPLLFRHMNKSFSEALPALDFHIAVKASLSHTNDMKESLT
ncbi:MAG: hypothetical protein IJB09_08980 [Oscillospiraceae bacterium]|nr:hypothetical protein [Oscillospiraceae bacterium]